MPPKKVMLKRPREEVEPSQEQRDRARIQERIRDIADPGRSMLDRLIGRYAARSEDGEENRTPSQQLEPQSIKPFIHAQLIIEARLALSKMADEANPVDLYQDIEDGVEILWHCMKPCLLHLERIRAIVAARVLRKYEENEDNVYILRQADAAIPGNTWKSVTLAIKALAPVFSPKAGQKNITDREKELMQQAPQEGEAVALSDPATFFIVLDQMEVLKEVAGNAFSRKSIRSAAGEDGWFTAAVTKLAKDSSYLMGMFHTGFVKNHTRHMELERLIRQSAATKEEEEEFKAARPEEYENVLASRFEFIMAPTFGGKVQTDEEQRDEDQQSVFWQTPSQEIWKRTGFRNYFLPRITGFNAPQEMSMITQSAPADPCVVSPLFHFGALRSLHLLMRSLLHYDPNQVKSIDDILYRRFSYLKFSLDGGRAKTVKDVTELKEKIDDIRNLRGGDKKKKEKMLEEWNDKIRKLMTDAEDKTPPKIGNQFTYCNYVLCHVKIQPTTSSADTLNLVEQVTRAMVIPSSLPAFSIAENANVTVGSVFSSETMRNTEWFPIAPRRRDINELAWSKSGLVGILQDEDEVLLRPIDIITDVFKDQPFPFFAQARGEEDFEVEFSLNGNQLLWQKAADINWAPIRWEN